MRSRSSGRGLVAIIACLSLSGCGHIGFILSDDFADPELVDDVPTAVQPPGSPDIFSELLRKRFPVGSPDILLIQQLRNEGFVVPPDLALEGVYFNRKRPAYDGQAEYIVVVPCAYAQYDIYWSADAHDRITGISGESSAVAC